MILCNFHVFLSVLCMFVLMSINIISSLQCQNKLININLIMRKNKINQSFSSLLLATFYLNYNNVIHWAIQLFLCFQRSHCFNRFDANEINFYLSLTLFLYSFSFYSFFFLYSLTSNHSYSMIFN